VLGLHMQVVEAQRTRLPYPDLPCLDQEPAGVALIASVDSGSGSEGFSGSCSPEAGALRSTWYGNFGDPVSEALVVADSVARMMLR